MPMSHDLAAQRFAPMTRDCTRSTARGNSLLGVLLPGSASLKRPPPRPVLQPRIQRRRPGQLVALISPPCNSTILQHRLDRPTFASVILCKL